MLHQQVYCLVIKSIFYSGILSLFPQLPETETSASKVICEMYNIQDTFIAQAQTPLRTMDEAHVATSPQEIAIFPIGLICVG